jgi:hypothetical protein
MTTPRARAIESLSVKGKSRRDSETSRSSINFEGIILATRFFDCDLRMAGLSMSGGGLQKAIR